MEIIGWTGTILVLFGAFMNAQHRMSCWFFYQVGNIMLLLQAADAGLINLVAVYLFFVCLNIYGYIQWKKYEHHK